MFLYPNTAHIQSLLLCVFAGARPEFDLTTLVGDPTLSELFLIGIVADWGVVTVLEGPGVLFSGEYTAGLSCVFDSRAMDATDFGVGGKVLLILAKTGDRTGDVTFVPNGLGLWGDRTGGSGLVKFSVWSFRGDAARGGDVARGALVLNVDSGTVAVGLREFAPKVEGGAPYVVWGSGIKDASSMEGVGACDNRSPI